MRILFLSPRQCWPAQSGARLREYHFLRALAQSAQVTYVHFSASATTPPSRAELPFCREVVSVPRRGGYRAAQVLRGAVGKWPLPILNYTCSAMADVVNRLMSENVYDLMHCDSIHMVRYGVGSSLPVVFNWHNIESEAMHRYSSTVSSPLKRWYAARTATKIALIENKLLQSAFGHIVCSGRELIQLREIAPRARIRVIENGVDTTYFANAVGAVRGGRHVVFVGTMNYYPNVEAATSFAERIWPHVRERLPSATLQIVGANPTRAVCALEQLPGITVTGTVPDVRPYYAGALAAIVPLRTGGGTRLKILEAMAAGVPVISTTLGAEGLAVTPGRDILMAGADDASAWIDHLTRMAEYDGLREQITQAAVDLVRNRYDWEKLGMALSNTYTAWLRGQV